VGLACEPDQRRVSLVDPHRRLYVLKARPKFACRVMLPVGMALHSALVPVPAYGITDGAALE
jgi:hypothetical protein